MKKQRVHFRGLTETKGQIIVRVGGKLRADQGVALFIDSVKYKNLSQEELSKKVKDAQRQMKARVAEIDSLCDRATAETEYTGRTARRMTALCRNDGFPGAWSPASSPQYDP